MKILPAKSRPIVFAFVMSMLMAFLMSGVVTFINRGLVPGFVGYWMKSYLIAWAVAFPTIFLIAPLVHRIVNSLVR